MHNFSWTNLLFAALPLLGATTLATGCASSAEPSTDEATEADTAAASTCPSPDGSSRVFQSWKRKVGCMWSPKTAYSREEIRCEWDGGGDHAAILRTHGKGKRIDVGDTVRSTCAPRIKYGDQHTRRFGHFLCSDDPVYGITCTSRLSAHGFNIAAGDGRQSYF